MSKSKVLSGSVEIMCTDFKRVLQLKVHEGVSQSKILQGSVTILVLIINIVTME